MSVARAREPELFECPGDGRVDLPGLCPTSNTMAFARVARALGCCLSMVFSKPPAPTFCHALALSKALAIAQRKGVGACEERLQISSLFTGFDEQNGRENQAP
jgi:hypothetical protein